MAGKEGSEGQGAPQPETKTVELAEGLRKGGDIVDSSMPATTEPVPYLDAAPADTPPAPAAPSTPSDGGDTGSEQ
jgi:hypothetical protein